MNNKEIKWEFFLLTLVLGILTVWQMNTKSSLERAQNPEVQEVIAVEVARLTNANSELRKELADLSNEEYNLAQVLNNKSKAEESIQSKQEKAEILAGNKAVEGPGIKLTINNEMSIPQLIDVLNALKNIGAEAISLNNIRITNQYSVWGAELQGPYIIEAIGGPAALSTSLTRRGGVIDQVEASSGALDFELSEQEQLLLPAGPVKNFKYAKTVESIQQ